MDLSGTCCPMVDDAAACDRAGRGGQWGPTLAVFAMASLLKLLVLAPGVYHSTDFEVSHSSFHVTPPLCCTAAVGGLVQEPL